MGLNFEIQCNNVIVFRFSNTVSTEKQRLINQERRIYGQDFKD